VSGATPPSLRRAKPLAQPPTWQDKPINLAVASHPIFWAKTAQSHPRLLQNFAPRKSAFIANTGDSNIHIARALFKNKVPFLLFFKKASALPVYPRAFKDTQLDAYELKFGEQWYNPQTDIVGRGRVMTYLPLTEEVPDTQINKRKHGQVLLRYSSGDKAGTHKVYV